MKKATQPSSSGPRSVVQPPVVPFPARGPALPMDGFLRLPQVLELIPISRSIWWAGVRDGRFPKAVKLSARTTAWRVRDILSLIDQLGAQ